MPLIAPLLLAAAAAAPVAAKGAALPRIEALVDQTLPRAKPDDPLPPERFCTGDKRWCLELTRGAGKEQQTLRVFDGRKPAALTQGADLPGWSYDAGKTPEDRGFDHASTHLWAKIVREAATDPLQRPGEEPGETISIGLLASTSTMYSGGGGSAEQLTLYRLEYSALGKPQMQEVLNVPLSANLMIRACFSEKDYKLRRGVCHDEYSFDARLRLDPAARGHPPGLIYTTTSISAPGSSGRMNDNSGRQLTKAELGPRVDPRCSYRRSLRYNPVTARYEFDAPGPDCSDYTVP
jgi:hypothetical protein